MMETALGKRLDEASLELFGRRVMARFKAENEAMDTTWRKTRAKFKRYAEGDYTDRKNGDESNIFTKSNIPTEFITGLADFMVARTAEDIFGSEPYFAAIPQGNADKVLSEQLPKHLSYKLDEAGFRTVGRQAIHRGLHLGEGIIKTTWRRDVDVSEVLATVLIGGDGKEIIDADGEYIYVEDFNLKIAELGLSLWAKTEIVQRPPVSEFISLPVLSVIPVLAVEGEPLRTSSGDFWFEGDEQLLADEGEEAAESISSSVLSKSRILAEEEGWKFEERSVTETEVLYEGLEDALVDQDDFTAELNIRHLGDSHGLFHKLSLRRSVLRDQFGMDEATEARIGTPDQTPKNAEKRAQAGEGEAGQDLENEDPEYECIEGYVRMLLPIGPNGEETMVRAYALVERISEAVIACDYWARVTPNCVSPFSAIVPCPMPGRWHGRGYHEIYQNQGEFIDRTFNAIIYRNKIHANAPGFVRSQAFKDAAVAKNFVIQAGKFYELNTDYTGAQALEFVTYPDLDSRTWQILELTMQMAQVRSGVTGASQGSVTNLPANGTATGVQSIMMSGSTLHKLPIECIKDGFEDALAVNAMILYSKQDRDETFVYMEGQASELIKLNAANVKGLKLNIRLLLTRMHEREALESAKAAIDAVSQYLVGIPEPEKDQVRPLFVQVLKALRISGADSILRHAVEVPPQDTQEERFNIAMNYKDVPTSIQRQIEADAGYTPAAPEAVGPAQAASQAKASAGTPPAASPASLAPEEPLPENAGL